MAVTTSGSIIVGLGYCSSAKNTRELLKVISTTKLKRGRKFFVGVSLDKRRRADALRSLDDAAAEAAALFGVGAARKRQGTGT
jgi:hypothetical protein